MVTPGVAELGRFKGPEGFGKADEPFPAWRAVAAVRLASGKVAQLAWIVALVARGHERKALWQLCEGSHRAHHGCDTNVLVARGPTMLPVGILHAPTRTVANPHVLGRRQRLRRVRRYLSSSLQRHRLGLGARVKATTLASRMLGFRVSGVGVTEILGNKRPKCTINPLAYVPGFKPCPVQPATGLLGVTSGSSRLVVHTALSFVSRMLPCWRRFCHPTFRLGVECI